MSEKIVCLGKEFASEEERREYFCNELRAKLPELKKIEGFPIGEDEDIINLSDPPYYTACPNPWLNDFIAEWEQEKESIPGRKSDFYVDEPYASDVSEGKNNPIYNAHSYHTKVPHPAIMRYILHYTQPGDIVLDGFAGTGMTGVAANLCGNPNLELKFKIEKDLNSNSDNEIQWGARKAICGDLSPIASFISGCYNKSTSVSDFRKNIDSIIDRIENNYQWLYQTLHHNGELGVINFTIWSDVFICSNCNEEIIFWNAAVDRENASVKEMFHCPHCNSLESKRTANKKIVTVFDDSLKETIQQPKSIPVLINYTIKGKRYEKAPDKNDIDLIRRIQEETIPLSYPAEKIMGIGKGWGDTWRSGVHEGITHVHHFFTKRNLIALSALWNSLDDIHLRLVFTSVLTRLCSKLVAYQLGKRGNVPTAGTLYISSMPVENNIFKVFRGKRDDIEKALFELNSDNATYTNSCTNLNLENNSIDYIFTDPPFGANIMYSELNFIWEAWIGAKTNIQFEAIENKNQNKSLLNYQSLMTSCFNEYYRVLKPGKWMTVEFSNTSAAVWNGIQTGLQRAGFVIANVAGLDKKQGSFKAITTPTAVKQDLVISCYKPTSEFESQFKAQHGEVAVWDFVSQHLHHLPSHIRKDNSTTAIVERSSKILYDRLITFYLMRGLPVPIDAKDFQEGLKQRFVERDGMFFTAEQAAEYDEKKSKAPQFVQLSLVVTNESDAIEWLKDRLRKRAQKYQDIMPDFRIATQSLRKGDTLPELQDILNENFIQESDGRWRTPDPNEAKDREALRTKVLLKEFNGYVTAISQPRAKKLKEVRVEALRAGFKNCWEQKDFKTIVTLGDMIPQNILLEDEQLLMYYDIAKDRV